MDDSQLSERDSLNASGSIRRIPQIPVGDDEIKPRAKLAEPWVGDGRQDSRDP